MRSGRRVTTGEGTTQGVVLHSDHGESRIRWDDGSSSWEDDGDLTIVENQQGDAFIAMHNGMGKRVGEVAGVNPILSLRENTATDTQVFMRVRLGLMAEPKHPITMESGRQLTLDIRRLSQTGTPTKGSVQRPDKRKLALAAAVAAGEAQLVRRGKLYLSRPVKRVDKISSGLVRVLQGKRRLTRNERRALRANKRRSKK